jgi:hypothetical protein
MRMHVTSVQTRMNCKDRSKLENSGMRESMFHARKSTLVWSRRDGTPRYVFLTVRADEVLIVVGWKVGARQSNGPETCCKAAFVAVQPQGGDSGCSLAWRFPACINRRLDWLQCCGW